jgi:hypothetical protein
MGRGLISRSGGYDQLGELEVEKLFSADAVDRRKYLRFLYLDGIVLHLNGIISHKDSIITHKDRNILHKDGIMLHEDGNIMHFYGIILHK